MRTERSRAANFTDELSVDATVRYLRNEPRYRPTRVAITRGIQLHLLEIDLADTG